MLAVNHMFASLRTNPSNHNEVLNEFASAMLCLVKYMQGEDWNRWGSYGGNAMLSTPCRLIKFKCHNRIKSFPKYTHTTVCRKGDARIRC